MKIEVVMETEAVKNVKKMKKRYRSMHRKASQQNKIESCFTENELQPPPTQKPFNQL